VLRHAKADPEPPPHGTDHDRPLAPRGRRDAQSLGRRLGKGGDRLGLDPEQLPEVVLCSTAARTKETVALALADLERVPEVRYLAALYGAEPEQVLEQLAGLDERITSAMVVGHNPTFQILVRRLSTGESPDRARRPRERGHRLKAFPTCAVAIFELPTAPWNEAAQAPRLIGSFAPPY